MPSDQYTEARNFRILTDKGSSSFSLENIKGNIYNKTIPDILPVQKITIIGNDPIQTIQINGSASVTYDTTNKTAENLYNFIITNSAFASGYNIQYNVYYNTTYILIVPILSNTLTINLAGSGLLLNDGISPFYIPAQTNLEVIGSTSINDDIYILTTNNTTKDPGGADPDSYGQIWKLVIDDANNTSVLSLIYNNALNFTTYHAIAPTAITGRFENSNIQRIYWTDFFNRVRSLNVSNPQAFATELSLIDLTPSISFDVPILSEIQPGGVKTMKVGAYQISYRFKNTTGSVTNFSPLSNIVSVTTRDEKVSVLAGSNNFADYCGDAEGGVTAKVISWKIGNVDINYDRIEVVVLIRESKDDVPDIYSFHEDGINGRTSLTIRLDGDILDSDNTTTLSLSEFLTLSGNFTHAKTLTTKDNRLIFGNIKNASADLNYDSRVYRFPVSSNTFSIKEDNATNNYTNSNWTTILDNSDAINANTTTQKYRLLSNTIGGDGPNISYEFISVAIESDMGNGGVGANNFDIAAQQVRPFRHTASDTAPFVNNLNLNTYSNDINYNDVLQKYSLSLPMQTYEDIKYPQYNGMFWGYQQNETYRFGIQFYDKAKNPYFVKWIGDIKFPDINDPCPSANNFYQDGTLTGKTTYLKTFTATRAGKPFGAYITQLGIKFNINIPANLTEQISGYSIVRVKRTDSDKTVIAEGIITSIGDVSTPNAYYTPDPTIGGGNQFIYQYILPERKTCFFSTPNFLISGITEPRATDVLNIRKAFQKSNITSGTQLGNAIADPYYIFKLYDEISTTAESFPISQVLNLGFGQDGIAANSYPVNNNDNTSHVEGNQTYFFGLTPNGGSLGITNYAGSNFKLYATVDRILNNQYGGSTYSDRSSNEYIVCSHFRSTKIKSVAFTDSPLVFGGDVINYHTDMQRYIKKWVGGVTPKVSTTFYFPSACCGNPGLRHGTFVNRFLIADDSLNASGSESYDYNEAYSCENDIVKYFPKPDPFISNDEFPNRFVISEIKINGELNDSWSVFLPLNYWDVEGTYGPINACDVLQDQVYFAQNRAFGKLSVNPRTAIQSLDGEQIQLGRGDIIDSHQYVSTEIGTRHQFSFLKSAYNIFFLDIRHKKIYAFNAGNSLNPLSDIKGLHGWLQRVLVNEIENIDKPVYIDSGHNGIHGVYDFTNNELIYTIFEKMSGRDKVENKYTLVYNDNLNCFTAYYDHFPKIYITNHRKFLSPNPGSNTTYKDLYLHNHGIYGSFYGVFFSSVIEFLSNKFAEVTKIFTNIVWEAELQDGTTLVDIDSGATPVQESFTGLTVSNDYQTGSVIFNVLTNLKRRFRTWYSEVPRSSVASEYTSVGLFSKMKDKFLKARFHYSNNNNRRLIVHRINTLFKINKPN